MASRTTIVCSSSLPRKCEQLIRIPSCHTTTGFLLNRKPICNLCERGLRGRLNGG